MSKIPLIVLMGPTASGKTSMAVEVCKKYGGEDDFSFVNGILGSYAKTVSRESSKGE